MTHLIRYVCVCDRDWCRCTNRVQTQDAACFMCQEGAHAEPPDPIRPPATDDEPWDVPFQTQPDLKPGCCGPILIMALVCWGVVIAAIWLIRRLVAG
jgi:hypothetical protein